MTGQTAVPEEGLCHLEDLHCDPFELGLLPVSRHFLTGASATEPLKWQRGYSVAVDQWGESVGFPAAHLLLSVLEAANTARDGMFRFQDPRNPQADHTATEDEALLIRMLHHMRRDQTPQARRCVEFLTAGQMNVDLVRTGLSFARRFQAGAPVGHFRQVRRPMLQVVS